MSTRGAVLTRIGSDAVADRSSDDALTGVPLRSRLRRLRRGLDRTPGKLRAARALVVAALLVTFLVGVSAALERVAVIHRIQTRTEPLSADVIQVYRLLADADATVAGEFLQAGEDLPEARSRYDEDLREAAIRLAHAGTLAGEPSLRTRRIAEIAAQLPVYAALVERARTERELRQPSGQFLQQASDLMRSTILRLSDTLQRTESANLDAQYREARSVPGTVLAFGLAGLVTLALLQLLLFRRTKRIVNVGLLLATAGLVGAALWWAAALSATSSHLEAARDHSQAVTDGLGEAQIAARQARSSELLALVPGAGESRQNFVDKMDVLVRPDPGGRAGGALGATLQFAGTAKERDAVALAVGDANAWLEAHAKVLALIDGNRAAEAVVMAIDSPSGSAPAFNALDKKLTEAIDDHDAKFRVDIDQATKALSGFVIGTGLLGLAAAAVAAWGITLRLEEYR